MKRAALYMRVSTLDQHPETQLYDLRQMAQQRGYQIVEEYTDRISGAKAKRPGLDSMMRDARRGRFDVVLVWASDRIARSVKHFLDVLDELNRLNVEFVSFREQIDTGGPLGRAVVVIIGAIAELERNLIIERVRAGMRRAKLEGRHIGRKPLVLDRNAILRDRQRGHSLSQLAKGHLVSRATIHRVLKEHASTSGEVCMKETTVWILMYMLLVAAFAYMIGWVSGELLTRCKNAEKRLAELRDQPPQTCSGTQEHRRQFKELRSVLNDAHKHIVAVSKALKIPAR